VKRGSEIAALRELPLPEYLKVRRAEQADFERMAQVYNESIRAGDAAFATAEKTAAEMRAEALAMGPREAFFVLLCGRHLLGFSQIKAYSDRPGYRCTAETSTFLDRNQRRKGFGTFLKKAIIQQCKAFGYHHLVAKIIADNQASIAYNLKLGYEWVGTQRQVGYRKGKLRDVALLQLILEDVPPFAPHLD